jgi:methyl coenzyme M reductase beta subunit
MIIREMNEGRKLDYEINGYILKIADREIDLQAEQKDVEVKIDIINDGQYLANIIIPPARYKTVEKTEIIDGETVTVEAQEREALDVNSVILQLWTIKEITLKGGI